MTCVTTPDAPPFRLPRFDSHLNAADLASELRAQFGPAGVGTYNNTHNNTPETSKGAEPVNRS